MPLSVNLKEEFCKQILQLDNSIRFAGIANMKGKLVAEAYREGLVPLLTKQETELSALQAIVKMATRESLEEKKLGKTICAILVNNRPVFFIQIVTPTSEIYSKVNNVFSIQRVEIVSLVAAASTVAIAVLVLLLRKWNIILRKEVKRRTQELEDSYDEMKRYLEEVLKTVKKKW